MGAEFSRAEGGIRRRARRTAAVVSACLVALAVAGCAGSATTPATGVTDTGATVRGDVFDSADGTVSYWFQYGPTKAYGSETTHRSLVIDDRENHSVSEDLTGLSPGTTFHYQVCAQDPAPICGGDRTFTTTGGPTQLSITAEPTLYPEFDPAMSDYVTRCSDDPVTVTVSAPADTNVSIDGAAARNGPFTRDVPLTSGRSFNFSATTSGQSSTYHVRCLPDEFPDWTYSRSGTPSAHFYITTPANVETPTGQTARRYVTIFDDHGVPVWWEQVPEATDAKLLPDGTLSWGTGTSAGTSTPGVETHDLDGSLVHTWRTVGSDADLHDFQLLRNGNALIGSYPARPGTLDLSSYGGPSTNGTLLDGEIEEIRPDGTEAWSWSTDGHIDPSETPPRWRNTAVYDFPKALPDGRQAFDWAHMNSFQQIGNMVVVSFRHLDAVYAIDKGDGHIIWKLGGTPTPKSLTVVGDPETNPLGGQHYARMSSDGTLLTLHDNNTDEAAPPRGVSYKIDLSDNTATLVDSVTDPDVPGSPCCGSAAELADGSWLMSWGGTPVITEFGPGGNRHFKLTLRQRTGSTGFSYRVDPITGASPTIGDLRTGMDAMP